jgi:signal transduction histidine kinase
MDGIFRILRRFVAAAILLSVLLLVFNFVLLGTLVFREQRQQPAPENVVREVAKGLSVIDGDRYVLAEEAAKLLERQRAWAMLIGEDGAVKWEERLPDDVPRTYGLTDVAKFSRYYLSEYPVYIWEHADGLVVVGYPKNSHGKFLFNWDADWVRSVPWRLGMLLILNAAVALMLSILMGLRLVRNIRPLVTGVHRLAREEPVRLDERGLLGDLAGSINTASAILQEKNAALKARDEARSNWIAGISHDIRTPLSMILGYASELEENPELPEEERRQAGVIRRQGEKLRSLVSDLNLVSMLEYDMQPLRRERVRLASLARQAAADMLNGGLVERHTIELEPADEDLWIVGDRKPLLRAIGNLLQNSVNHNPQGCRIVIGTFRSGDGTRIGLVVRDDGRGVPREQLAELTELPYSSKRTKPPRQGHGLGLPMVDRIVKAHGGRLLLDSPDGGGLIATMEFPAEGA